MDGSATSRRAQCKSGRRTSNPIKRKASRNKTVSVRVQIMGQSGKIRGSVCKKMTTNRRLEKFNLPLKGPRKLLENKAYTRALKATTSLPIVCQMCSESCSKEAKLKAGLTNLTLRKHCEELL